MSNRQRPGKRERETSVKAAIRKVRNAKMGATRKVIGLLREEQRLARGVTWSNHGRGGSTGYGSSSANRDKLKGGTGSIGFYGGRGFYSERAAMPGNGTIGRMTPDEATPRNTGATVPRPMPNVNGSRRFAEDEYPVVTREEKRSVMIERKQGKGRMKVYRPSGIRLPDPTAKK